IGVAREGPGGVARQKVDLARGERGEAGLAGGGHVLDLRGIAEHGGGDGLADGHVEALPVAVRIRRGKADEAGVHATDELTPGLHIVKRRRRCEAGQNGGRGQRPEEYGFFHAYLFLSCRLPRRRFGPGGPGAVHWSPVRLAAEDLSRRSLAGCAGDVKKAFSRFPRGKRQTRGRPGREGSRGGPAQHYSPRERQSDQK